VSARQRARTAGGSTDDEPLLGELDSALSPEVSAELEAAPDHDARIAILLRHVAAHPESGALRWGLYHAYMAIDELEAARRQLEEGLRLGLIEFVLERARTHPDSVDDETLARVEGENVILAQGVRIARGEAAAAEERLREIVTRSGASYRASGLDRATWVDVTALALERGSWELGTWMDAVLRDGSDRFDASDARGVEPALHALVAIQSELPELHVRALARGLRAQRASSRGEAILTLRRAGDPDARRVLGTLREHQPILAEMFRDALVGPIPAAPGAPRASPFGAARWVAALVVVWVLLRAARGCLW